MFFHLICKGEDLLGDNGSRLRGGWIDSGTRKLGARLRDSGERRLGGSLSNSVSLGRLGGRSDSGLGRLGGRLSNSVSRLRRLGAKRRTRWSHTFEIMINKNTTTDTDRHERAL